MPIAMKTNKEEITLAAIDLFNKRGYWGVSMREISDACGIVKASLYHHFQSKALLAAACVDMAEQSVYGIHPRPIINSGLQFLLLFKLELQESEEALPILTRMMSARTDIILQSM